jgi:hypothetical protein
MNHYVWDSITPAPGDLGELATALGDEVQKVTFNVVESVTGQDALALQHFHDVG